MPHPRSPAKPDWMMSRRGRDVRALDLLVFPRRPKPVLEPRTLPLQRALAHGEL